MMKQKKDSNQSVWVCGTNWRIGLTSIGNINISKIGLLFKVD